MVEFLLFLLCSVLIARSLEKRYKVASALHAVLFVVIGLVWLFSSNLTFVQYALTNVVGETAYGIIRAAVTDNVIWLRGSFSALLIAELVTYFSLAIVSLIAFIKGLRQLATFIKTHCELKPLPVGFILRPATATVGYQGSGRDTYLETRRLRN